MPALAWFVGALACAFFGVGFLAGCVWAGRLRDDGFDDRYARIHEALGDTRDVVQVPSFDVVVPLFDWSVER